MDVRPDVICSFSDDGFCYFGLWMVELGRDALVRAVADPDTLADAPEVQRLVGRPRENWDDYWPAWESLDYVALEAHGLLTGIHDNCGEAFYEAIAAQQNGESTSREPVGEQCDVRHEDEAVRKLPRLSAAFPLRPLAL
ncbi:DUF4240 domain-containing protein [Streptomyces sp. NPDC058086]|uniref:DUF4240 domain-containing protein n=1 Tax=Streptomyces sp. NPDC058086 TaxID=3346334 RepID=UPI0036DFEE6A